MVCYCKIDFVFRSSADGSCMHSSMSLLLLGNNLLVQKLRCLTSIDFYLHSEFYGKYCFFESAALSQKYTKKSIKPFFLI